MMFAIFIFLSYAAIDFKSESVNYSEVQQFRMNSISTTTNEVIDYHRMEVNRDLADIIFPSGTSSSDFIPELGGTPLQIILITTWRSGSTFVGNLIASHPGNYFYYEPMTHFGSVRIRGPPKDTRALKDLYNLLKCNFIDSWKYVQKMRNYSFPLHFNKPFWSYCEKYPNICFYPEFMRRFCSLYPVQTLKILRLSLKLTEKLIANTNLNVKVILLVRDPRATYQSRKSQKWCIEDCRKVEVLCSDLESDYSSFMYLKSLYPDKIMSVRYEEISLNPYEGAKAIFNFLGLQLHPKVIQFVEDHTRQEHDDPYNNNTFRNSEKTVFRWRKEIDFADIINVQSRCRNSMQLWGYEKADKDSLHIIPPYIKPSLL